MLEVPQVAKAFYPSLIDCFSPTTSLKFLPITNIQGVIFLCFFAANPELSLSGFILAIRGEKYSLD